MSEATTRLAPDGHDPRPVVRTGQAGNLGLWLFLAAVLLGGLLLFEALSERRANLGQPVQGPDNGALIAAPPPLALAPAYPDYALDGPPVALQVISPPAAPRGPAPPPPAPRIVQRSPASLSPDDLAAMGYQPIQAQVAPPSAPLPVPPPAAIPAAAGERVFAGRLANPSLTVPKGTIVAAVLETALDSTRPGGARAIVSRDVRSFDGTRVLIPRGSRLYGEYAADVSSGQKRALVRWERLLRPDAVAINLDSPSADPLGRAGIEGRVNSHFLARFGSAIVRSVLDIGVGLATRTVTNDAVIVALPGSTQQVAGQLQPGQVQPTLRVQQGTSVSVFVSRDLDFSSVDG